MLTTSASSQVILPGGGGTGGTGGEPSWGGIVVDMGPEWHAEAFPEGTDTFVGWGVNATTGLDESYTLTYDWATGRWAKNGVLLPPGVVPATGTYGYALNTTHNSHGCTADSHGTVQFKMQWIGNGPAPAFVDVKMVSSVDYGLVYCGNGTCDDGMTMVTPTVDTEFDGIYGRISEKRYRRYAVSSGIVQFGYAPSASSSSIGYNSNCGARALWINGVVVDRNVTLWSLTYQGTQKKEFDGGTSHVTHSDWDGFHDISYATAAPRTNLPVFDAYGMTLQADVGIPLFELCLADEWPESSIHSPAIFQGVVNGIDDGTYQYSAQVPGQAETLPNSMHLPAGLWWEDWTVDPFTNEVYHAISHYNRGFDFKAGALRDKFDQDLDKGFAGQTETVKFKYTWDDDGVSSEATVLLNYKLPLERLAPAGSWDEIEEPENPLVVDGTDHPYGRVAGFEPVIFIGGYEWAANQSDNERATWNSVLVTWISNDKASTEKVKAGASLVGLIPAAKTAATAVGAFADFYAKFWPRGHEVGVSRKYECLRKAYNLGMISPMPLGMPTPETIARYDWKVYRRQLYTIRVFGDDLYNDLGYVGQKTGYEYDLFSYDERQEFRQIGSGGGGAQ